MMRILPMTSQHAEAVLSMMRVFYASPAVATDGSEEIFRADVAACLDNSPYLEGYVLETDGCLAGYAMVAKSFSTEYGCPCIWIEDLYLKPQFRNLGYGSGFFTFLEEKYAGCVFRLEVEADNQPTVHTYRKNGFDVMPYTEIKKGR